MDPNYRTYDISVKVDSRPSAVRVLDTAASVVIQHLKILPEAQETFARLVATNAAAMSQPDRQLPKGDLSCLVDLVPDMASLMQAERNAGAKDLVILGGLGLDSPLPKTEWEQLGAR
jgi:hypothetical protein